MAKYLKIFNEHSQYESYASSEDFLLPNVSWCADQTEVVHYNPFPSDEEPSIIATYYVEGEGSIRSLTMLYYVGQDPQSEVIQGVDMFSKILIDGNEVSIADIDADGGYYSFTEGGEHEVIYYLIDPTTVPMGAFAQNGNYDSPPITEIEFGEGVEVIDGWAFNRCSRIESIVFPSTLVGIVSGAFTYNTSLTSLDLSNTSLSTIGFEAFFSCENLVNVSLPSTLTTIEESAFNNCQSLSTVNIPSSVTTIGNNAFIDTSIDCYSQTWYAIHAINPNAVISCADSK